MAHEKPTKEADFSDVEIEQIARSWILIAKNLIWGDGKKDETCWPAIQTHYEEAMNDFDKRNQGVVKLVHRSIPELQSKWSEATQKCTLFSGAFYMVDAFSPPGTTYEEQVARAKAFYLRDAKGEDINFLAAWELVRDSKNWHYLGRVPQCILSSIVRPVSRPNKVVDGLVSRGNELVSETLLDGHALYSGLSRQHQARKNFLTKSFRSYESKYGIKRTTETREPHVIRVRKPEWRNNAHLITTMGQHRWLVKNDNTEEEVDTWHIMEMFPLFLAAARKFAEDECQDALDFMGCGVYAMVEVSTQQKSKNVYRRLKIAAAYKNHRHLPHWVDVCIREEWRH